MQIVKVQLDEWLYVCTDTAERARKFFGLPDDTECRKHYDQGQVVWAVKAPDTGD